MRGAAHPRPEVLLATHNPGKRAEMAALLAPLGLSVVSAADRGLAEPRETGTTFAENALIKAEAAARATGLVAIADDSGLCVEALDGAPGLFTADWCGMPRSYEAGMARLHRELAQRGLSMEGTPAHFVSAIVLKWPAGDGEGADEAVFEGRVFGHLAHPARRAPGSAGFGFDPVFVPTIDGQRGSVRGTRTFAEMAATEKNALSHRGRALALLIAYLRDAGHGASPGRSA